MRIDSPVSSQTRSLWKLWQEAFGDTEEFLGTFERTAFSFERCRCITAGGEVVAALYWFDCEHEGRKIAYIYAVATAKSHRGQGLCHKLMEDTHRHLRDLGYKGALLVPGSAQLFRFYEGMGYTTCSYINKFRCKADTEDIPLRLIDTEEYALLRRRYIPAGGVIQEQENLRFLEAYAKFYAGENFLLTAATENSTLQGIELLGDASLAPHIVKVLGCEEGEFRCAGGTAPFGMYCPLSDEGRTPPAYFGLAFD